MKLLLIGGKVFLGRHIVEAALRTGHEVTLFNRGKTNPELYADLEQIHGDRLESLSLLEGRKFDAVIDTCACFPRAVDISKAAFPDSHYTFISSISVFKDTSKLGLTEEDGLATVEDPTTEEVTGETYGPLKALCEKIVLSHAGGGLVVRPGLIVGPHDPTDRFTYWPAKFWNADNGSVLAPNVKLQPMQIIDVRDLSTFIVRLVEQKRTGVFNVTGPKQPATLQEVLNDIQQEVNSNSKISWVSGNLLKDQEVQPWSDLPLVLPYDGSMNGMLAVDLTKSLKSGLAVRSITETARDTLEWWRKESRKLATGLTRERELELIEMASHAPTR